MREGLSINALVTVAVPLDLELTVVVLREPEAVEEAALLGVPLENVMLDLFFLL